MSSDYLQSMKTAHPVDKHVGAKMRIIRRQLGLSQTEVANKLGITFQQVQKYERGANRISASKLFETAAILGIPINEFFEGLEGVKSEVSPRVNRVREFTNTSDGYELVERLARLSGPELKLLRNLADTIYDTRTSPPRGGSA